jgi:uncharacterized protein (DUF885 family)
MTHTVRLFSLAILLLILGSVALPAQPSPKESFDQLVDRYFEFYYPLNPTEATADGFHRYDTQLDDASAAGRVRVIAGLKKFLAEFEAVDGSKLPEESAGDLEFLKSRIRAQLLELESIRMWSRNPDAYTNVATYSVFLLMKRNFAPQEERLRSVIAREKSIPKFFDDARRSIRNPPHVYTEVALDDLEGTVGFFEKDVPSAFSEVKDAKLLAEFHAANQRAIEALKKYQAYLKEMLPKSNGDFRLGAENYSKKLLYDEMVDIPLDRLLEIGYADLRRNQQRLKEVAARIDPNRPARDVLADLQKDHPTAEELLPTFRGTLAGLKQFIEDKKIITIPSEVLPIIEETPPFQRALTTASMDTPGAYESVAKEAYFNVTPVEPNWPAERKEQWLQGFNRSTLISVAVHEAYPGHYTQFLWVQSAPSKVRKLVFCSSNAEGWAHYTEQMMLDEGYGNGDPKLRLGQILDALLRDARFISGIEMHTGKMTLAQSKQFFIDEGYQVPAVADAESKRGTSDPTYLYYTLGKLQILKLREDYKAMKGDKFSLQEFHDQLMRQGGVPLKLIRKAMLGNDTPTL